MAARRNRCLIQATASLLLAAAGSPAWPSTLRLGCTDQAQRINLLARTDERSDATLDLVVDTAPSPAVLVLEESGADLEWRENEQDAFRDIASRPPRFGVAAWNVEQGSSKQVRVREKGRGGSVSAQVVCRAPPEIAALPLCLAAPALWTRLAGRDASPWCDALIAHGTATAAARKGENLAALEDYRHAAVLWQARSDTLRESAALLGAAEILFRLDRYEDAIAQAEIAAARSRAAGYAYFALRARGEICLAQRELGRRDTAHACQAELARDYAAAHETADAANAYISLGSMAHDDGAMDLARAAIAALATMDLAQAPVDIAPRARLLRAALAVHDGRIAEALSELEIAANQFEQADNRRWLATAWLRIASLYGQIGASGESRHFAEAALPLVSGGGSPTRRALALRLLAAARASDNPDGSAAQFAQARGLLVEARSPLGIFAVDIAQANALGDAAALQRAMTAVETGLQPTSRALARLQLLRAQQAFAAGDRVAAESLSAATPADALPFSDYLRLRVLRATLTIAAGDIDRGFSSLNDDIDRLRRIAAGVASPALRYMAGKRLALLRAAWIDAYAQTPEARRPDVAALWLMLQKTQRVALLEQTHAESPTAEEADRQLARLLLEPDDGADDARVPESQRELLRFYLQPRRQHDAPIAAPTGLHAVRDGLPADGRLLAFALGDRALVSLSIGRDGVAVRSDATAAEVRAAAGRLRRALSSPDTPLAQIRSETELLSQALFSAETAVVPGRLLLMPDHDLEGIPFALLEWPRSGVLVDSTAVSVVSTPLTAESFAPLRRPRQMLVLAASLRELDDRRLPPLLAVVPELDALRRSLTGTEFVVHRDAQVTRERVVDALGMPDAWVHVAAHGDNSARLQSYSGLWISPVERGKSAALVSWLELSERGVRSDLLMLSSCGLGASPSYGASGAISFGAAMNAAGARHVVAALWPVGDTAAAQFSRAFYESIAASPQPDPARAVAVAQRRLREITHFRHPYHWSLFVHLQR